MTVLNSKAILIKRQVSHMNATAKETKPAWYRFYLIPAK